jgi:polysaccharide pyruvyl transferase WcaK-like protein
MRAVKERLISRNPILNKIYRSNYVACINGGDSFSDIYGLKRFFFVALPQFLVLFLNKPLILLPQTIGPFKGAMTKFLARCILKYSSTIYSRDYIGLNDVKELMNEKDKSNKMKFCHDVAFVIESLKPPRLDLDGLIETNERKQEVIGLNVSGLLYIGGYTKNNMFGLKSDYKEIIYDLLDILINKKQLTVLLVPHTFGVRDPECDNLVSEKIYAELKPKYKDKLFLARGMYNQNEIKYIIGMCDFFIGARMHACIAALSQCIPAVGIAYSKKFKGVFETVGLQHLVADPRVLDKKAIFEIVDQALEDRNNTRAMLQALMPEVRREILNIFKDLNTYQ